MSLVAPLVSRRYAQDLFTFGGVYFSALPPHPPANLPDDVAAQYRRFIDAFEGQWQKAKAMRRADPSGTTPVHLHLHPFCASWRASVIAICSHCGQRCQALQCSLLWFVAPSASTCALPLPPHTPPPPTHPLPRMQTPTVAPSPTRGIL